MHYMVVIGKMKKIKKTQKEKNRKVIPLAKCGLCGKTGKLTKTECCNQWICNDVDQYVMFSFARNSCYRNHRRYTLCGYHFAEEHHQNWKDCPECKSSFKTEMYVYYGTNEYNFEKLKNPPEYKPTKCEQCKTIINLGEDAFSMKGGKYFCYDCSGNNSHL